MRTCNECGRLASRCDCEKMMLDVYDTEIVPGEDYYENEHEEAVHTENLERYVLEEKILIKKTR